MVKKKADLALKLVSQIYKAVSINDVRILSEIKRDVIAAPRKENDCLPEGVRITGLIENVWIAFAHVCDDNISLGDLVYYPGQNVLCEHLFIYTLTVCASGFAGFLYSELVGVTERLVEWHQNENERSW